MRRGFTLLWEPNQLTSVIAPERVLSIRQFFALGKHWPEELPGANGDALVVAGLEGCLDALSEPDAVTWLEADVKKAVLSFQQHYEGGAALILWVPSGRTRIGMVRSTEEYFWRTTPGRDDARIPI